VTLTNQQCITTLSFLLQHPEIACHVQKLVVRPNHREWYIPENQVKEKEVTAIIQQLATHLSNLHTFIWDGQGLPGDLFWYLLRTS